MVHWKWSRNVKCNSLKLQTYKTALVYLIFAQCSIIRPPFIRALALHQFNSFIHLHIHKIYINILVYLYLCKHICANSSSSLGRNAKEATATAIAIVVDYIAAFGLFSAPLAIFEQNIFNLQFFSLYADYDFFLLAVGCYYWPRRLHPVEDIYKAQSYNLYVWAMFLLWLLFLVSSTVLN